MTIEQKDPRESPGQTHLTDFGKHLISVMVSKDLRNFADLSRLLGRTGVTVSRQTIANYANGHRAVPASFVVRLADELDLSREERQELAWSFAYGQ